jgi:hypothetical protein
MKMGTMPKFSNFMKLEKDMTNMFKKSLVAVAICGFAGAATAAELDATPRWFAQELASTTAVNATTGLATDADALAAFVVEFDYVMKANYTINDTVTFTITGNAIREASLPDNVVNTGSTPGGTNEVVLSRISSSTASGNLVATYRVTKIGDDVINDTINEAFTFSGLQVLPRNLTGAVTVSYAAQTATGLELDTSGAAAKQTQTLTSAAQQFSAISLDKDDDFSAVIDVNQQRLQFTAATADPTVEATIVNGLPVTDPVTNFVTDGSTDVTHIDYTINGNFAWLLDDDGDVDADVAAVNFGGCGAPDLSNEEVTATSISYRCASDVATFVTIEVAAGNEVVIPRQSFSVDATVAFDAAGTAGTKTLSTVAAGEWTLNGSSVNIPYMPYGANISQVINLNNAGSQTGDITVEGFARGEETSFGPYVIGEAVAGRQTAIAGAIKDVIHAKGLQNERVSLTIVTNVPGDDVTVYSAYNVNGTGARLVVNDSNGKD